MMETSPSTSASIPSFRWCIVGSAFCICFLVDGIQLSFGILLVDLVEKCHADRAITAVLAALVNTAIHVVGKCGFDDEIYEDSKK